MKLISYVVLFTFFIAWSPVAHAIMASTNVYYSVDIGGDLELSDPNVDGDEWMDPGDIYQTDLKTAVEVFKDDALIFGQDPAPPAGAPVGDLGPGYVDYPENYFDLDGEDQLEIAFSEVPEQGYTSGIAMTASKGLFLNPNYLLLSYDDDQASGWYANDVPVNSPPDHGPDVQEVLTSHGWLSWSSPIGLATESQMGLAPDPVLTSADDDDVDALDTRALRYWYWSSDHEAHYNTDPGNIYLTDRNTGGYTLWIHKGAMGFNTTLNQDVDIDAFEFCVTDNASLIQASGVIPQGAGPYLVIVFSVDEDDPITPADESGGLDPKQLYISFFNQTHFPLPNGTFQEDIDGVAFEKDGLDYGDAPDSNPYVYPTTKANDGARHIVTDGVFLGAAVDIESDGQPTAASDGDDLSGTTPDDEDGVYPASTWYENTWNSVDVIASTTGYINAWFDFNLDGDWADTGEQVLTNASAVAGANRYSIAVPTLPQGASIQVFTRWRYCTQLLPLSYTGQAPDGEVEDHIITIMDTDELANDAMDYGDADISFPVLLVQNGARHITNSAGYLGILCDLDVDGQPTPAADGDDINNQADEDGVTFNPLVIGTSTNISVMASASGLYLSTWFDFNQDGDWQDSGEKVLNAVALSNGINTLSIAVPATASLGDTYARFRATSVNASITTMGMLPDGEVEDYLVPIYQPSISANSIVITNLTVSAAASTQIQLNWSGSPTALYTVEQATGATNDFGTWSSVMSPPTATNEWSGTYSGSADTLLYRVTAPNAAP